MASKPSQSPQTSLKNFEFLGRPCSFDLRIFRLCRNISDQSLIEAHDKFRGEYFGDVVQNAMFHPEDGKIIDENFDRNLRPVLDWWPSPL